MKPILNQLAPLMICSSLLMINQHVYAKVIVKSAECDPVIAAATDELWPVKNYEDLIRLIETWRRRLTPAQRHALVVTLLPHLSSRTELPFTVPKDTVIEARFDVSRGFPAAVLQAKHRLKHDPGTEAGRVTIALEELLLCDLPPIASIPVPDAARNATILRSCQHVVAAMNWPAADIASGATVEQRVSAASAITSSERLLAELSKDPAAEVRCGVAANPNTPLNVLDVLQNDQDKGVSSRARENRHRARVPKNLIEENRRNRVAD
jgi:hypothetical protein